MAKIFDSITNRQKVAALEAELMGKSEEIISLTAQVSNLNDLLSRSKTTTDLSGDLKKTVNEHVKTIAKLKADLQGYETSAPSLQDENEKLKEQVKVQKAKIAELKRSIPVKKGEAIDITIDDDAFSKAQQAISQALFNFYADCNIGYDHKNFKIKELQEEVNKLKEQIDA